MDISDKVKKVVSNAKRGVATIGLLAVLGYTAMVGSGCASVAAGHMGLQDTWGNVSEPRAPGLYGNLPWTRMIEIDARTQETKEQCMVPSKEGLVAKLDISVLYHPDPTKVIDLYKSVGVNYKDIIVEPMLRNVTRDVVAGHSCEDLYGANRGKISSEILSRLKPMYAERNIVLENVLLRDVELPLEVRTAIEAKIKSKQQAEAMVYVLQKETQEAERRRVEARGIADAQAIIAKGLSPEYLQWKYIETLHGLAGSPNTTFVFTPFDQKLVPMIQMPAGQHGVKK